MLTNENANGYAHKKLVKFARVILSEFYKLQLLVMWPGWPSDL